MLANNETEMDCFIPLLEILCQYQKWQVVISGQFRHVVDLTIGWAIRPDCPDIARYFIIKKI